MLDAVFDRKRNSVSKTLQKKGFYLQHEERDSHFYANDKGEEFIVGKDVTWVLGNYRDKMSYDQALDVLKFYRDESAIKPEPIEFKRLKAA